MFPQSTKLWHGLPDLYCAYVIILVHTGVRHTDSESAHFWLGKIHKFFLCSWRDSNLGPLDLESNALPIEPPRHPLPRETVPGENNFSSDLQVSLLVTLMKWNKLSSRADCIYTSGSSPSGPSNYPLESENIATPSSSSFNCGKSNNLGKKSIRVGRLAG